MSRAHHRWTPEESELLREIYADHPNALIGSFFGVSRKAIGMYAHSLGLRKSDEFMLSKTRNGQFRKGNLAHNKGVKQPGLCIGGMSRSQFKPGHLPQTWVPIGTEVCDDDGYLKRKVTDRKDVPSRRNWIYVHRAMWQEAFGPIPADHIVTFRDGDKKHITLDNLQLISMTENVLRNSFHNLPAELKEVIQLNGRIRRRLTWRKKREEQNVGPAQPPVRDTRAA